MPKSINKPTKVEPSDPDGPLAFMKRGERTQLNVRLPSYLIRYLKQKALDNNYTVQEMLETMITEYKENE